MEGEINEILPDPEGSELTGRFFPQLGFTWRYPWVQMNEGWQQVDPSGGPMLPCGIYHIPYFATETGEMPIVYLSMPQIEIVKAE